jgi:hypothetical protein
MSKKVTISVPDGLHQKMEKWRESFNFSQIFQKAVSELIKKREDLKKRIGKDTEIKEIIERLRKEKVESEGSYYEDGRSDGFKWAKAAHYNELIFAIAWDPRQGLPDKIGEGQMLREYFSDTIKNDKFMEFNSQAKEEMNEYALTYITGFKEGLQLLWDEIKEKL